MTRGHYEEEQKRPLRLFNELETDTKVQMDDDDENLTDN